MPQFKQNCEYSYIPNPYYGQNSFKGKEPTLLDIPKYEDICHLLPKPIFEGREDYIACYEYAWKTAFSNLFHPFEGSGFVSDFIDTAFNGHLFMWDSSFILMFTKYANRIFPFQKTLDNFYALQHKDGFICREIDERTGTDFFARHEPVSTGPNILAWCEWIYFENFGDLDRLRAVYAPLRAYHIWMRRNFTWRDGSYFSSGLGCGMDNIPRLKEGYHVSYSNGKMIWVDACLQAALSCDMLIRMNKVLGGEDDVSDLVEEKKRLETLINTKLWDEATQFYYDMWDDDTLNGVKHLGGYWSLISHAVPQERVAGMVSHLENENEFNRPTPIPTLSYDNPNYSPAGDYWRGSAWAPTNYMVLKGLGEYGYDTLAHDIAKRYLDVVTAVYEKDHTLWENYAPESVSRGNSSRPNFVGWTGLAPISIFFEYVMGIRGDVPNNRIVWHVNCLEKHGIENYPFGCDNTLTLVCEGRDSLEEEPQIYVTATSPVDVLICWNGEEKLIHVGE